MYNAYKWCLGFEQIDCWTNDMLNISQFISGMSTSVKALSRKISSPWQLTSWKYSWHAHTHISHPLHKSRDDLFTSPPLNIMHLTTCLNSSTFSISVSFLSEKGVWKRYSFTEDILYTWYSPDDMILNLQLTIPYCVRAL